MMKSRGPLLCLALAALLLASPQFAPRDKTPGAERQNLAPWMKRPASPVYMETKEAIEQIADPAVRKFVEAFLAARYTGTAGDPQANVFRGTTPYADARDFARSMLEYLTANIEDPFVLEQGRARFISPPGMEAAFRRIYPRNAARKFDFDALCAAKILESLPDGARVADIGCGTNRFLARVKEIMDERGRRLGFVGTDIYVNPATETSGIEFHRQPSPYELPPELGTASCEAVFFRAAMHHIGDLPRILNEVARVLKPGGRLILIEDTFNDLPGAAQNPVAKMADAELSRAFAALGHEQKIRALKFNDWYANYFYHEWTGMPLPMHHRSSAEWKEAVESAHPGMNLGTVVDTGIPGNEYAVHQPSTCLIVFEFSPPRRGTVESAA